jgi:hypothetical protein
MARWRYLLCVAAVSAFALTSTSCPAASEHLTCKDPELSVVSQLSETAALACAFAMAAKDRLAECGLTQRRPIRIFTVDKIQQDFGDCLATYDCSTDILRVLDPESIPGNLEENDPYSVLPTEIVFRALMSHEMAHALLEQSSVGTDIAFVDHEYVAAAMELENLDAKWRDALMRAAPVTLPPKTGLISELIYGFAPRKFATNAWHYFDAEPDGCLRIQQISKGEFSFDEQPR